MYVCVCKAVTERQVENAIDNGAKTVKDLNAQLGVGSECGSCVSCAKACLNAYKSKESSHLIKIIPVSSQVLIQTPRGV